MLNQNVFAGRGPALIVTKAVSPLPCTPLPPGHVQAIENITAKQVLKKDNLLDCLSFINSADSTLRMRPFRSSNQSMRAYFRLTHFSGLESLLYHSINLAIPSCRLQWGL